MAGRRLLKTSSVSQLTLPHETIASCYRRSRHRIPTAFRTAPCSGTNSQSAPARVLRRPVELTEQKRTLRGHRECVAVDPFRHFAAGNCRIAKGIPSLAIDVLIRSLMTDSQTGASDPSGASPRTLRGHRECVAVDPFRHFAAGNCRIAKGIPSLAIDVLIRSLMTDSQTGASDPSGASPTRSGRFRYTGAFDAFHVTQYSTMVLHWPLFERSRILARA